MKLNDNSHCKNPAQGARSSCLVGKKNEGGLRTKGCSKYRAADKPLISVITVVSNGARDLAQSIQSVIGQSYKHIEYVIIDGGSTDGTVDIIRKYEEHIDYWISEPDSGIYNAMNKGWMLSHGDYIYYLGADDVLLELPAPELINAFMRGVEIVYGDVCISDGRLIKSRYDWRLLFNNILHHQGLFLKKTTCEKAPFNERYKVFADFDLEQRLYQKRTRAISVGRTIACFGVEGVSNKNPSPREFFDVIHNNNGPWAVVIAYIYAKFRGLAVRLRRWANLT